MENFDVKAFVKEVGRGRDGARDLSRADADPIRLNGLNSQVAAAWRAASIAGPGSTQAADKASAALKRIRDTRGLSNDVGESVAKALQ